MEGKASPCKLASDFHVHVVTVHMNLLINKFDKKKEKMRMWYEGRDFLM